MGVDGRCFFSCSVVQGMCEIMCCNSNGMMGNNYTLHLEYTS